ncbi:MAG TPA: NAD(P)-dependent oxidoreductase [Bryobacteraceae bacterium]|jgi:GDP-L-fucose synthase|nr:NAD(P)-dependent oxidoreductase [Bryobacteraceae bacterium]
MRVLVTGASGFIGRNLLSSLRRHHQVFAPMRAELDLLDDGAVRQYLRMHHFDVVVHAATVRANRRIGAPPDLMQQNCRTFFNLARNPDAFGKLLFLNSGAVYDRRSPLVRVHESCFDRSVPSDPYGFSKYICSQYIGGSSNLFDLRLFGVFGPYEDWETRFLSNACCRAVWDLPVTLNQNVRFDYLDVADLAELLLWFIANQPRHRAYNLCTGRAIDLIAYARKIVSASGKNLPVVVREQGLGDEYSGDNRRLLEEVPGFPFRSPDDSIHSLYSWYAGRKAEIDPACLHFDSGPIAPPAIPAQEFSACL